MSLSIAQLREVLLARAGFSAVQQVGDSVIRSTRKADEIPFAVYYFDIAQTLPGTQDALTRYQDQVIGSHYFEGGKSLQWSNYLYFIITQDRFANPELRKTKEFIESDRNYARKFVIPEEELDSVLNPEVVQASDAAPQVGVLSIWREILVQARLDNAIFSNDDLPRRVQQVESPRTADTTKSSSSRPNREIKEAPYIQSLQLKQFRDSPLLRNFQFGTVNLLVGANGTGKTSLLEAIELFYCGRNKRNPNNSKPYELLVDLSDGRAETATNGRLPKVFRERNLDWYGQPELKTNDLYLSFGQFNFLDTDAAVSLSESTLRIEDDLAKLLVGADASKTWRNIERVGEAVAAQLRELRVRERQIKEELAQINRLLTESGSVRQELDSIRTRLEDMILRLGWSFSESTNNQFPGSVVESLSELESLVQQAISLGWTESPVSINGLTKYCGEANIISEQAEADIARLDLSLKDEKRLAEAAERNQLALVLAGQAKRYIDVGLPTRIQEVNRQNNTLAKYSNYLAGPTEGAIDVLLAEVGNFTLPEYCETIRVSRSVADESLVRAKSEYANFTTLREESLNLAQQLREVSAKILKSAPKPDECPLCHTQFAPGELINHIHQGIDEEAELLGQTLLSELRKREDAVREAVAAEAMANWLKTFCERTGMGAELPVHLALGKVLNAKRVVTEAQNRVDTLKRELLILESQGLSATQWKEHLSRLGEFGFPLGDPTPEAASNLLFSISQALATTSQALEVVRNQIGDLQRALEATLGSADSAIQDLRHCLAQLRERCSTTQSLRAKLMGFSPSVPWSGNRPLAELVVESAAVRQVAAELQTAQGKERQARSVYGESKKREEELMARLARLVRRIKRLTEAQTTFDDIRKNHSLAGAMQSALNLNRAGIEAIFSCIHSPPDFVGLGSNLAKLVRKADGQEAALSEISTGQRAAFALSIFLAQNSQLRLAPPVLLIDDPIAHVDDLNSLSFLDYLREIALTGRRQIFFATANNKLATLFERKFDFLGNKRFRRFDLPPRI